MIVRRLLRTACLERSPAQAAASTQSQCLEGHDQLSDLVSSSPSGVIAAYGASFSEWLDVPFDYTTKGERGIIDPWKSWFDIFPDATCEVRSLVAAGRPVADLQRNQLRRFGSEVVDRASCAWASHARSP